MRRLVIAALVAAALVVAGAAGAVALFRAYPVRMSLFAAMTRNYLRSLSAPKGATTTELNPAYKARSRQRLHRLSLRRRTPPAGIGQATTGRSPPSATRRWPKSTPSTVGKLKVLCTYDTGQYTSFESGLIMVEGALIGTTNPTFSRSTRRPAPRIGARMRTIPPSSCRPMRGAAYLDGMLFRGTQDGRVLAYDFKTGKRIWADDDRGREKGRVRRRPRRSPGTASSSSATPAATPKAARATCSRSRRRPARSSGSSSWFRRPRATSVRGPLGATPLDASTWNNAPGIPISGGGTWTSYTLDPTTGELYVPVGNPGAGLLRSACARARISIPARSSCSTPRPGPTNAISSSCPRDWHDWDVASPPSLIETAGGKKLMAEAPKDGHLYGFDLADNSARLSRAGDQNRECRRAVLGRRRGAFLPGRDRRVRSGTARPTIRRPTLSSSARSSGARP